MRRDSQPRHAGSMNNGRAVTVGACFAAALALIAPSVRADEVAVTFSSFSLRIDSQTTFGFAFNVTSPTFVSQLGYYDFQGEGLTDSHPVTIWTSDGTPVVSATVPAGTAATLVNGVRYVPVSLTPLPVGSYTIGGFSPSLTDSVAIESASVTSAAGITYVGSRSAQGSSLAFPTGNSQGYANGDFGPDFQIVPEPSAFGFLVAAAAGACACRRRQRLLARP